jgi:hypothetical protein
MKVGIIGAGGTGEGRPGAVECPDPAGESAVLPAGPPGGGSGPRDVLGPGRSPGRAGPRGRHPPWAAAPSGYRLAPSGPARRLTRGLAPSTAGTFHPGTLSGCLVTRVCQGLNGPAGQLAAAGPGAVAAPAGGP